MLVQSPFNIGVSLKKVFIYYYKTYEEKVRFKTEAVVEASLISKHNFPSF